MSLFKKFAATTLALTMVFSLAACGGSSDTATTEEGGDAATTGKVYKIGTDTTFAPFEFQNDAGEFVGIDIDLLNAIAEDQGFEVELQSLGFNAAVQALEAGQVDGVIGSAADTARRGCRQAENTPGCCGLLCPPALWAAGQSRAAAPAERDCPPARPEAGSQAGSCRP